MSKFEVADGAPTGIVIHKRQADGSIKKFSADKKAATVKVSSPGKSDAKAAVARAQNKRTVSLATPGRGDIALSSHKPGTPYRFKHGWIPVAGADVSKVTMPHVDGSRIHKSDAAAEMYGSGSAKHMDAIRRFGQGGIKADPKAMGDAARARAKAIVKKQGGEPSYAKVAEARKATVKSFNEWSGRGLGPGKYSAKTDRASSVEYTEVKHTAAGSSDSKVIGTVAIHPKGGFITSHGTTHTTKAQAIAAIKKRHGDS